MSDIPEVFAIFEQKLAHVLSFTIIAQRNNTKQAIEELLAYFSGIVERASKAEARIAELERNKEALSGIKEILREHIEIGTLQLSTATARIAELEEQVWNLNLENERLEEAYFVDETIAPDGTLKPSVRKLLERLEKAETDLRLSDDLVKALDNRIAGLNECVGSKMADIYTLKSHLAETEALVERLIDICDWATIGMVISNSYSSVSEFRKLAEDRRTEFELLRKNWESNKQEEVRE